MPTSRRAKLGLAVAALAALPLVPLAVLRFAFPRSIPVGPSARIETTPELLARGRYLVKSVTVCVDCHSTRDWGTYAAPVIRGTEGLGGEVFPKEAGFPGTFRAPNITPTRLSGWTDGEIRRALTAGLTRDGRALFPLMPWPAYASLCDRDQDAVIAHLRTLAPLPDNVPASEPAFPFSLILRTLPRAAPSPPVCPDPSNQLAQGHYLATVAACQDCHTPQIEGRPIAGKEWAGGFVMALPSGGIARTANLTPDLETGLGRWSRETFIARFRAMANPPKIAAGEKQTVMPWSAYAGMTDDDLGAIFLFLRTLPAVVNKVETFERAR